jgi:hypothetical protein
VLVARYLVEVHLPSENRAEFARLVRVMRSARLRIEDGSSGPRVGMIGLVSSGRRTYCVVQASSAGHVSKLMQTAMLPSRIRRITELDPERGG